MIIVVPTIGSAKDWHMEAVDYVISNFKLVCLTMSEKHVNGSKTNRFPVLNYST